MSRFPTLGIAQLRPAASPVDQFTAPDIAKPKQGNALLELAGSLASITPELGRIVDSRFRAHVQTSTNIAKKDQAHRQFQNMKDLNAAVKRGELAESSNPWYMLQMKQDVRAAQINASLQNVRNKWDSEENPTRFSDDPEAVRAWIDEQTSGALEGLTASEAEVVAPMIEQGTNQIVGRHIAVREGEREIERSAALGENVAATIRNAKTPEEATAQLQQMLDRSTMTMSPVKANAIFREAVMAESMARRDPKFAETVLRGVKKSDGSPALLNAEVDAQLRDLPYQIREADFKEAQLGEKEYDLRVAQSRRKFMDGIAAESDRLGIPIEEIEVDFRGMPFELRKSVSQELSQFGSAEQTRLGVVKNREKDRLSAGLFTDFVEGRLDPVKRGQYLTGLARLGAFSDTNQFLEFADRYKKYVDSNAPSPFGRDTDPETYFALTQAQQQGSLDPKDLITLASEKRISEADFHSFMKAAVEEKKPLKVSVPGISESGDEIKGLIQANIAAEKTADVSGSQPVQVRVQAAQAALARELRGIQEQAETAAANGKSMTQREMQEAVDSATDKVSKQFGGMTKQERREQVLRSIEAEKREKVLAEQEAKASEGKPSAETNDFGLPVLSDRTFSDNIQKQIISLQKQGVLPKMAEGIGEVVTTTPNMMNLRSAFNSYTSSQVLMWNRGLANYRVTDFVAPEGFSESALGFGDTALQQGLTRFSSIFMSSGEEKQAMKDKIVSASRDVVVKERQRVLPDIRGHQAALKETLNQIAARGTPPDLGEFEQIQARIQILNTYDTMLMHGGLTEKESVEMQARYDKYGTGQKVWKNFVLFAHDRDVDANWSRVADSLQVPAEDRPDFIATQKGLLNALSNLE